MRRDNSHKLEATVGHLVNLHLPAPIAASPCTYLSLGFSFHSEDVALECAGDFLPELQRSVSVPVSLDGLSLFQDMQKPPQDTWGKTLGAWKPPWSWRKT